MYFGELDIGDCLGCYLAHSHRLPGGRVAKGTCLSDEHLQAFVNAGTTHLVVAQLEPTDVHEDESAQALAEAVCGEHLRCTDARTGRVNLHAMQAGLIRLDAAGVVACNGVSESITLATMPPDTWVPTGRMVATVKIIPYAVPQDDLQAALTLATGARLQVKVPQRHTAALVQTRLPGIKESVLDKTRQITVQRLEQRRTALLAEERCAHEVQTLANTLRGLQGQGPDWLLVVGASAISDRADVIPAAIETAGGSVQRFGLPMDPGNLLLIGTLGQTTVLGLPGCARSPKDNGLDRVLDRLACDLDLPEHWLSSLAVGGLLTEIADRPRPRSQSTRRERIGGLILAAGQSHRAGAQNKLLYAYAGVPLVAHVARALRDAGIEPCLAVTGHDQLAVSAVLAGEGIDSHYNPGYVSGMAGSLAAGVSQLIECDALIVCLGDMPHVTVEVLQALVSSARQYPGKSLFIPVVQGRRGNPVLIAREFFDLLLGLEGDTGARALLAQYPGQVQEVPVDSMGILEDYDTTEALGKLSGRL